MIGYHPQRSICITSAREGNRLVCRRFCLNNPYARLHLCLETASFENLKRHIRQKYSLDARGISQNAGTFLDDYPMVAPGYSERAPALAKRKPEPRMTSMINRL